jgi:heme-degrading monooxygenase HmoA
VSVFARAIRFEGISEAEWGIGHGFFREDYIPRALETDGFAGAYLLADRERGSVLSLTFWTSKETLEASENDARRFLAQYVDVYGSEPVVESFEVAYSHPPARPTPEPR